MEPVCLSTSALWFETLNLLIVYHVDLQIRGTLTDFSFLLGIVAVCNNIYTDCTASFGPVLHSSGETGEGQVRLMLTSTLAHICIPHPLS